jgi:CDP-paratose 2-epimerase
LIESHENISIVGIDNLARSGSERNRVSLQLFHGDIRMTSDLEALPVTDWVIDAAAQQRVLAGRDGRTCARQLLEHNFSEQLICWNIAALRMLDLFS